MQNPGSISLTRPDDWHVHVRDGDVLGCVVPHTAAQFGRAVIMPNLRPPITTVQMAQDYARRISSVLPAGSDFEPLMTLYLTDKLDPQEILRARDTVQGAPGTRVMAVKFYPAGATTNSDAGVTALHKVYRVLETMQETGMPLLVHGEVTTPDIDLFDREAVFIDTQLIPLRRDFPQLKIVLEHITTEQATQYVSSAGPLTAATITAHHLLFNRNALFTGGMRPHYYCLPVLKREKHRRALVQAATSDCPQFFLGTDSAPHAVHLKEHASGCAGCYTAHAALELYAQAFDSVGALSRLEAFASFNGPDFYGLPRNTGRVTLRRETWRVPADFEFGQTRLVPLGAGEPLSWRL